MGQKYSEVPAVDYWVQLTRSADKAGAGHTLPVREVPTDTDFGRWELDRFAMMQRYRTAFKARLGVMVGDAPAVANTLACIRCGRFLGDGEGVVARQVWYPTGGHVDWLRCRTASECKQREPMP